ncbi:hypothetical protein C900_00410 [Fulvivirga imtechensis AK7]|uniref:Uncharacterized protein n=1 Tax=Fulvivirga imtechensis AK7 TaxID=1237149 RepID=L8JJG2_9BACT|nr:hypothetical protein [Fulvivirga imtechensis]ELR68378.1 hypothetical protein C900_00410 [Fulvivirga imtechensis AK7]
MLNILYLAITLNFSYPDFILIANDKEVSLATTKTILLPENIEVRSDKSLVLELMLSSGGRLLWLKESRTNREIRIPQYAHVEYLVVKIKEEHKTHIYRLKLSVKDNG